MALRPWQLAFQTQENGNISNQEMIKFAGEQVPQMFDKIAFTFNQDNSLLVDNVFHNTTPFYLMMRLLPQVTSQYKDLQIDDKSTSQILDIYTPEGEYFCVTVYPESMSGHSQGKEDIRGCHFHIEDSSKTPVGTIGYYVNADGMSQSTDISIPSDSGEEEFISIRQEISDEWITTLTTLYADDNRGINLNPRPGTISTGIKRTSTLKQVDQNI